MTKKRNKSKKVNPPAAELPGESATNQILSATAQAFSGPLPPPEILAKYNSVVPNAAERIITMAETQAAHRQRMESKVIESNVRNSQLGLHYGVDYWLSLSPWRCCMYPVRSRDRWYDTRWHRSFQSGRGICIRQHPKEERKGKSFKAHHGPAPIRVYSGFLPDTATTRFPHPKPHCSLCPGAA